MSLESIEYGSAVIETESVAVPAAGVDGLSDEGEERKD